MLGDKDVALVAFGGAFRKARAEDLNKLLQVGNSRHSQTSVWYILPACYRQPARATLKLKWRGS